MLWVKFNVSLGGAVSLFLQWFTKTVQLLEANMSTNLHAMAW